MNTNVTREQFSASWLSQALEAGGIGTWFWDMSNNDLHLDEMEQQLTGLYAGAIIHVDEMFNRIHPDDLSRVKDEVERAMSSRETFRSEFRFVRDDGTTIWLGGRGDIVALDGKNYSHFAGVNWDITALKQAEFQSEMTAKEMAHRVKNLLALVGGVARMTAKNSQTLKEFLPAFAKRLNAIAGVNQLILGTETRRDSLKNLIDDTLHSVAGSNQISMKVDDFELNARAAQTMVLVLNELATNAVKYGALAKPDGTVALSIVVNKVDNTFTLRWAEQRADPIDTYDDKQGFGAQVLNSLTKATYEGEPSYTWHEHGLTYQCVWAAQQMSIENQPSSS